MSVRDTDRGANALMRELDKDGEVRVGIMGREAREQKDGDGSGGLTVAEVGSFHEFGLGVPRRSFLRDTVDQKETRIRSALKQVAARVGRGAPLELELERIGLQIQGIIQDRISQSIPPPLAPETIRRKKSSVSLIDTGQLRSSITYAVTTSRGNG